MLRWPIRAATCLLCLLALAGCSKGYERESGKWAWVWFDGDGRQVRYLEDAAGKLTVLGNEKYAATADHVYLWGVKLPNSDPATFRIVTYPYSKDATHVYCGSVPIVEANPQKFRVLGGSLEAWYFSSAKAFEKEVGPITSVPSDAAIIGARGWSTDGTKCFYGPNPVAGANAANFKILNDWYATDGSNVFCGSQRLAEADVESFQVVGFLEAEDRNHTYYKEIATKRAK